MRPDKQIGNLVDAIAEGLATQVMKCRLGTLERERSGLARELEAIGCEAANVVAMPPNIADARHRKVEDLQVH